MPNNKNVEDTTAPPLKNLLLEGRTVVEWLGSSVLFPIIPKKIKGEGRPVLVFPPFLTNDVSTNFIRRFLKKQGFVTYKWDNGFNLAQVNYLPKLERQLRDINECQKQKVSLIGWSAGGFFARMLANRQPDLVEQVITLATPFRAMKTGQTNADCLFALLNGSKKSELDEDIAKLIERTPPVPTTCIYTKTDGIVSWKHCIDEAGDVRNDVRNVEVYGSHGGLGVNPSVLLYVAKVLAKETNVEFSDELPSGLTKVLYPKFWQLAKRDRFAES